MGGAFRMVPNNTTLKAATALSLLINPPPTHQE